MFAIFVEMNHQNSRPHVTIENDKSSDTTEAWNACLNHFNSDFEEFEYISELNNMLDSHTSPLDLNSEMSFEQRIEIEPTLEF